MLTNLTAYRKTTYIGLCLLGQAVMLGRGGRIEERVAEGRGTGREYSIHTGIRERKKATKRKKSTSRMRIISS